MACKQASRQISKLPGEGLHEVRGRLRKARGGYERGTARLGENVKMADAAQVQKGWGRVSE